MKLKYLYIENYKKIKKTEIQFETDSLNTKLYKEYYPNLSFNILVGENGTGKTTIMSFICRIFNNLQRYHDRIECDFILKYSISNEDKESIEIEL